MFGAFKRWLDRCAIRAAAKSLPAPAPRPDQIQEAREILASPGFMALSSRVPDLRLGDDGTFRYMSERPSPWQTNNIVHGRLFPARKDWRNTPVVMMVHGWNADTHYQQGLPRIARFLNRFGASALAVELPYHCQRRAKEPGAVSNFISDDVPVMLRATDQSLSDIHGALLWMRQQGVRRLGIWGFSLGGWLAGLYTCQSDLLQAAVLATPVSNMEEGIATLEFCAPIRAALGLGAIDFRRLNLTNHQPRLHAKDVLLVHARHDQFIPGASLKELGQRWGGTEFWELDQGHISILMSGRSLKRISAWIAGRLEAGRV